MLKSTPHRYFVTFFDSNYLAKALVTYTSLTRHHPNFTLYAFCFDNLSYSIIKSLNKKNFIAVSSVEFENKELLKSKQEKDKLYEYYWSCKPFLILKVMQITNADMVTYIDCDFMFFDSPELILSQMDNADVLIQPNNFSFDEVKQFLPVGYYCSCFETFRNNRNGKKVLNWWHDRCMEWCFARFEDNKFADQKYLDDWRIRFKGVREINHIGANVAPWSIQKYDTSQQRNKIFINNQPLIYYHFHSYKMNLHDYSYSLTGDRENYYRIPADAQKIIYPHYTHALRLAIIQLKSIPEYANYANENPNSIIKTAVNSKTLTFDSYKKAADSK